MSSVRLIKIFVTKYPYKAVSDSVEKQILQHRNCVVIKNLPDYNTNKRYEYSNQQDSDIDAQ